MILLCVHFVLVDVNCVITSNSQIRCVLISRKRWFDQIEPLCYATVEAVALQWLCAADGNIRYEGSANRSCHCARETVVTQTLHVCIL
jgi:hypothetical protein